MEEQKGYAVARTVFGLLLSPVIWPSFIIGCFVFFAVVMPVCGGYELAKSIWLGGRDNA